MTNSWHMVITISWQGNVRQGITMHQSEDFALGAVEELLAIDPDAERGHVLLSKIEPNGIRRWVPVKTIRKIGLPGKYELAEVSCA